MFISEQQKYKCPGCKKLFDNPLGHKMKVYSLDPDLGKGPRLYLCEALVSNKTALLAELPEPVVNDLIAQFETAEPNELWPLNKYPESAPIDLAKIPPGRV